jgi:hypothetical protein
MTMELTPVCGAHMWLEPIVLCSLVLHVKLLMLTSPSPTMSSLVEPSYGTHVIAIAVPASSTFGGPSVHTVHWKLVHLSYLVYKWCEVEGRW